MDPSPHPPAVVTMLLLLAVVMVPLLAILGVGANEARHVTETIRPQLQRLVDERWWSQPPRPIPAWTDKQIPAAWRRCYAPGMHAAGFGTGRGLARAIAGVAVGAALVHAQGTLSLREVGASILNGTKGVESLRGKTVAGFSSGECRVDAGGLVASIECSNGRTLEEAAATPALELLLKTARTELKAPEWKETKWIGAKTGASFKHASGAEINIGIPEDLLAGLPNSYGPVMLIALAADP